jgi:hypothetical protein
MTLCGVALGCVSGCGLCAAAPAGVAELAERTVTPLTTLRLGLSSGTHIVFEPKPGWLAVALANAGDRTPIAGLGLEFNTSARGPAPWGPLRVPLTGDSAFQFRPRARSMSMSYSLQF